MIFIFLMGWKAFYQGEYAGDKLVLCRPLQFGQGNE